jgi:uncharacterized protein YjgD (DUF1641 family)
MLTLSDFINTTIAFIQTSTIENDPDLQKLSANFKRIDIEKLITKLLKVSEEQRNNPVFDIFNETWAQLIVVSFYAFKANNLITTKLIDLTRKNLFPAQKNRLTITAHTNSQHNVEIQVTETMRPSIQAQQTIEISLTENQAEQEKIICQLQELPPKTLLELKLQHADTQSETLKTFCKTVIDQLTVHTYIYMPESLPLAYKKTITERAAQKNIRNFVLLLDAPTLYRKALEEIQTLRALIYEVTGIGEDALDNII